MGSNVPTFPFTLPTGGAEPLCVSHVYPEKVNSLGPTWAEELPLLGEPVLEGSELEVLPEADPLLPDDPVLEVPLPEDPVEALLPDDPVLEVPLPVLDVPPPVLDVPPRDGPLLAGTTGMVPPPQPTRKQIANNNADILSMKYPFAAKVGGLPISWPDGALVIAQ